MGLLKRIRNANELKKIPESNIALVVREPTILDRKNGAYDLGNRPDLFIGRLNFVGHVRGNALNCLSSQQYGCLTKDSKYSEKTNLIVSGESNSFETYNPLGKVGLTNDFLKLWKESILVGEAVYSKLKEMKVSLSDISSLREMANNSNTKEDSL